MCLEVLVQISAGEPRSIGSARLAAASGLTLRKIKFEGETAFHVSTDGTCSCGLLSDDAAFESELWALADDVLDPLARLVEALRAEKVRFRFLAHWLGGERPRHSTAVRANELCGDIRANRVRNNVVYEAR